MKMQHALGKLDIAASDKISPAIHHSIYSAIHKNNFIFLTDAHLWETGVLNIDRQRYVNDGDTAVTEFVGKLAAILLEEGIPELELNGEIILTINGEENSDDIAIYRILVENNTVFYAKADLKWENYTEAQTSLTKTR